MSTDLLKLFAQRNGCFPNKIIFYRDGKRFYYLIKLFNFYVSRLGVDDGHFQKVLDNEIRALENACKALYMNNPLPKLTFIIVKKRHNTRFFVGDPNTRMMDNVQPGTVVDTDIVHPEGFDFYLNSHAALQGSFNFRFFLEISFIFKEHQTQFYIMFYMMKLVFHPMKYNL
jgi:eukaryotic translation initiation factor 2C